ncbi:MAG: 50S ribosomal protein L11 methyltransferase [Planctomycetota bacterium]
MNRRHSRRATPLWLLTVLVCLGCSEQPPPLTPPPGDSVAPVPHPQRLTTAGIVRWVSVPQLPQEIVILDSVFWEPADTDSLRQRIVRKEFVKDARVLEIGTGSGLLSLCCLSAGAAHVVATDLNPAAIDNVRENAARLEAADRLDARLVPRRDPSAWSVIRADETFDLIVSNPPWEDQRPESVEQFALYDPGFQLLQSLLQGTRRHLRPGGRIWLAYGCRTAIQRVQQTAAELQLECELLDDRRLEELPELFLPGMLIEVRTGEGR